MCLNRAGRRHARARWAERRRQDASLRNVGHLLRIGVLPLRADQELPEQLRDARLQDRSAQVITTCGGGGQAALGAKLLKDMGFEKVAMIDGGTTGWKNAGLPVQNS